MYSMNCLEWHPGDERQDRTPQLSVVGLDKVASEAFACRSIVLLLLSPRAKIHQRDLRGFSFWRRPYSTRKQCIYMDGLEQNIGLCNHPTDNPRELCARYHARLVDMVRQDTNRMNRILQGKLVTVGNGLKGSATHPWGYYCLEKR